jgi:DNA (cytosine-5)-methyltransferase 1
VSSDHVIFLNQPSRQDNLVDLFCGCGGSGGGLLDATEIMGRKVSGTFVNHWDKAIQIHQANHPEHRHLEEDLFMLDPAAVFPVGTYCSLLWASPQCTFFSVARGASCVNEQDRSHAHSVTDWVKHLNPEAVICENVKEFRDWGPVMQKRHYEGPDKGELMWALNAKPLKEVPEEHRRRKLSGDRGREASEARWVKQMLARGYQPYEVPDKTRKGEYFDLWLQEMKDLGYMADHRVLKSADFGDPTIRARLFIYFVRKDTGRKIVWPEPYAGERGTGHNLPMDWRTARDIIQWELKGQSVFTRDKDLADNTFRRLAIGLVKYGLRDFLVSSAHGSPKTGDCNRRVHDLDQPLHTLTAKGDRGVVTTDAYVVPHHTGSKKDWVKSIDQPVSTVTSTMTGEGLAVPSIVQLKGQSTAQDVDAPLTALTQSQSHYLMQPEVQMVDHLRGTGIVTSPDEPIRTIAAGGQHQALAEAFMFAIDQTGGGNKNDGTYPIDSPTRTLVTKANQACIEMELEVVSDRFLQACSDNGVDTSRAVTFLGHLVDELTRRGKVDAKPWIYVYYSSGSEGKSIDEPLPTVRTKAGHALVYPVIEMDGKLIRVDLFYRMLTPLELQRAMGFPDDMEWAGVTKTETIRAIGNSVSRGVSRALGLAWYSQTSDVWSKVKHIYER